MSKKCQWPCERSSWFCVTTALADEDIVWLGIEVDDADVEVLPIEEKPNLGVLACRLSLVGLLLDERAEWLHRKPDRVIDEAVDRGTLAVGEAADGQLRNLTNVLGHRTRGAKDAERA
jgi:hypothetical protein